MRLARAVVAVLLALDFERLDMNLIDKIIEGDCNLILPTFESECIDLIVTDIPYGINYKSNMQNYDNHGSTLVKKDKSHYFQQIANDDEIPIKWLNDAYRVLKNNTAIYIFCHWSKWHILHPAVEEVGFKIKNMIVINKSNHGMGDLSGQYAPKHELLLFAVKGRHILDFENKRMNDVWDKPVKFSGSKRWHSCEKPVSWITPCISNSSKEKDIILDPFAGSGTTGCAAKLLNRNYIMIDIDTQAMRKRLS